MTLANLSLADRLQIAGRPFAEALALRAADAYGRDTGWHTRKPTFGAHA